GRISPPGSGRCSRGWPASRPYPNGSKGRTWRSFSTCPSPMLCGSDTARERRSRAFRLLGWGRLGVFSFAQRGTFLLLLDLLFLLRLLGAVAFGALEPIIGSVRHS